MSADSKSEVAPWDIPWTFTVTWDPEVGRLPWPILRLFKYRSTITPGRAVKHTDRGHATHYERATRQWLAKYDPDRSDIAATASVAADLESGDPS